MLGLGNLYKGLERSIHRVAGVFTDRYKTMPNNSNIPEIQIVSVSNAQRVEIGDTLFTIRTLYDEPMQRRVVPYGVVIPTEAYESSGRTLTSKQRRRIKKGSAVCVGVDPHSYRNNGRLFHMKGDSNSYRGLYQGLSELHQREVKDQKEAVKQPRITIDDVLENIEPFLEE